MTVSDYIHDLQKRAIYIFRQDEISKVIKIANESIRKALTRLIEKNESFAYTLDYFVLSQLNTKMQELLQVYGSSMRS